MKNPKFTNLENFLKRERAKKNKDLKKLGAFAGAGLLIGTAVIGAGFGINSGIQNNWGRPRNDIVVASAQPTESAPTTEFAGTTGTDMSTLDMESYNVFTKAVVSRFAKRLSLTVDTATSEDFEIIKFTDPVNDENSFTITSFNPFQRIDDENSWETTSDDPVTVTDDTALIQPDTIGLVFTEVDSEGNSSNDYWTGMYDIPEALDWIEMRLTNGMPIMSRTAQTRETQEGEMTHIDQIQEVFADEVLEGKVVGYDNSDKNNLFMVVQSVPVASDDSPERTLRFLFETVEGEVIVKKATLEDHTGDEVIEDELWSKEDTMPRSAKSSERISVPINFQRIKAYWDTFVLEQSLTVGTTREISSGMTVEMEVIEPNPNVSLGNPQINPNFEVETREINTELGIGSQAIQQIYDYFKSREESDSILVRRLDRTNEEAGTNVDAHSMIEISLTNSNKWVVISSFKDVLNLVIVIYKENPINTFLKNSVNTPATVALAIDYINTEISIANINLENRNTNKKSSQEIDELNSATSDGMGVEDVEASSSANPQEGVVLEGQPALTPVTASRPGEMQNDMPTHVDQIEEVFSEELQEGKMVGLGDNTQDAMIMEVLEWAPSSSQSSTPSSEKRIVFRFEIVGTGNDAEKIVNEVSFRNKEVNQEEVVLKVWSKADLMSPGRTSSAINFQEIKTQWDAYLLEEDEEAIPVVEAKELTEKQRKELRILWWQQPFPTEEINPDPVVPSQPATTNDVTDIDEDLEEKEELSPEEETERRLAEIESAKAPVQAPVTTPDLPDPVVEDPTPTAQANPLTPITTPNWDQNTLSESVKSGFIGINGWTVTEFTVGTSNPALRIEKNGYYFEIKFWQTRIEYRFMESRWWSWNDKEIKKSTFSYDNADFLTQQINDRLTGRVN